MRRCLGLRHSSSLSLPTGVPAAAKVLLPRNLLAISGPDSAKFLNGLLTIRPPDSTTVPPGFSGKYAGILNSKGRVVLDTFVYPAHNLPVLSSLADASQAYLLEVDTDMTARAIRLFEFYKLQSNVTISLLDHLKLWFAWNDEGDLKADVPIATTDVRAPGLGSRLIVPSQEQPAGDEADFDTYRLRRYLFGVPEGSKELIPDKALPLEYCMDYMGGIDFHKGCYVGQELTIRTFHHGVIRKRVAPIVGTPSGQPVPEELYDSSLPVDLPVGTAIVDQSPVPDSQEVASVFESNPFGASTRAARPAGTVVASLGNVGLASIRIDKIGHQFGIPGLDVHALTPYWWPEPESN